MSSLELKTKLVEYLNKKGIDIQIEEYERLIWIYKPHFSSFRIILEFDKKDYSDDFYTIRYYTNSGVEGIKKRRTRTNVKNFQYNVYTNLSNIKTLLDVIAIEEKTKKDTINKYCSELFSHYSKIHEKISIDINQSSENININITTHD